MSRIASVLLLLVAFLFFTLGTTFIILSRGEEVQLGEAAYSMMVAGKLLQQLEQADRDRLLQRVVELADSAFFKELLKERPADEQQLKGWLKNLDEAVEGLNTSSSKAVTQVGDFFVLDRRGFGLARYRDSAWIGGPLDEHQQVLEAIGQAAEGTTASLLLQKEGRLLRSVVVPVVTPEGVAAILYATFPLNDALAESRCRYLNRMLDKDSNREGKPELEFAYVSRKGISAGAITQEVRQSLGQFIRSSRKDVSRLTRGQALAPRTIERASNRLLVAGVPLGEQGKTHSGGIVLARRIELLERPLLRLALDVQVYGLVVFLVLTGVVVFFSNRLVGPVRRLEAGLMAVAHTNWRQGIQARLQEWSGRIRKKQLKSSYQATSGRDANKPLGRGGGKQPPKVPKPQKAQIETTRETRKDHPKPRPPALQKKPHPVRVGDDQEKQSLPESLPPAQVEEGQEEQYYREVYRQFVSAKEEVGEKIERLNFERFVRKLKSQEELIKKKQGCRKIEFEVTVRNNQVSLRPRIIW